MALNYNISDWSWQQGGQVWGFDPRITDPKHPDEKTARDALTADEITTIEADFMFSFLLVLVASGNCW